MDVEDSLSKIFDGIGHLDSKMQEFCFERHPIAAILIAAALMFGTAHELAQGFSEAYAKKEEYHRKVKEPILCVPVTNPDPGFAPR